MDPQTEHVGHRRVRRELYSSLPTSASTVRVRLELLRDIEEYEKQRRDLYDEEMKLETQCEGISSFFLTLINLSVAMTGAGVGILAGTVVSSLRTTVALLGIVSMAYLMCVGMAASSCYTKLKSARVAMIGIRSTRTKLLEYVVELQNTVEAINNQVEDEGHETVFNFKTTRRISRLVRTLSDDPRGLKEENMTYLVVSCIAAVLYLASCICWTIFMRKERQKKGGFGGIPINLQVAP